MSTPSRSGPQLPFDLTITPEPSPEERAAILIALEALLVQQPPGRCPTNSAWAMAGRLESLGKMSVRIQAGWGGRLDREPH